MPTTTEPLTAKQVAQELETDPRTFRKFLREITPRDDQPGQGGRWTFTRGEATKLRKRFEKWAKEGAAAKEAAAKAETNGGAKAKAAPAEKPAAKGKGKAKVAKPLVEPEEIEDLELEDLDDPDAEDLDEDEDLEDLD